MRKKWRRLLILSTLLLSVFFFREYTRVNGESITSWSRDGSGDQETFDCGVVLTGSSGRLREGFALLANHQIRKLIISGVNPQVEIQDLFVYTPFYGDLKEEDIILEKESTTTFGNAQHSRSLAKVLKCQSILLITSQLHMYRAYRTFKGTFKNFLPIYKQAIPRSQSDLGLQETLTEVGKSLFYSLWSYD